MAYPASGRILILIMLCNIISLSTPYNILALFPVPAASHYLMFDTLLKELVNKGHAVDVLNHFPKEISFLRLKDLNLSGTMAILRNNLTMELVRTEFSHCMCMIKFLMEYGDYICKTAFDTDIVNQLRSTKKKYDVVLTELFITECMLGFGFIYDVPVLSISSSRILPWGNARIGNPDSPSYIPNNFLTYSAQMNFLQRLENVVLLFISKFWHFLTNRKRDVIVKRFFGSELPDLDELEIKSSLILINSHYSVTSSRPTVSNFIEVGGLHILPPIKLPQMQIEDVIVAVSGVVTEIIHLLEDDEETERSKIAKIHSYVEATVHNLNGQQFKQHFGFSQQYLNYYCTNGSCFMQ